jgi:DNA-binding NtrC family response regulator
MICSIHAVVPPIHHTGIPLKQIKFIVQWRLAWSVPIVKVFEAGTREQSMKKRILIIDDDASIRSSLEKILVENGYQLTAVADGDSAQSEFAQANLLILDLNLPLRDGWDILGQVNSGYPLLPVIVITGLADQLDERTIPGASAFLEKPIEVPELLQTVDRLLNQTPEEKLAESETYSEFWQPSVTRLAGERRPRRGAQSVKPFKTTQ